VIQVENNCMFTLFVSSVTLFFLSFMHCGGLAMVTSLHYRTHFEFFISLLPSGRQVAFRG